MLYFIVKEQNITENKNEQQTPNFKLKLGNITYTVKVHFNEDTNKTFKDKVQKLFINEYLEKGMGRKQWYLIVTGGGIWYNSNRTEEGKSKL